MCRYCPDAGVHFAETSLDVQLQRNADAQAVLEFRLSVSSMMICSVVKVVTCIVPDKALLRLAEKFHDMPDVLANNLLCLRPHHRNSMQGLPRPSVPLPRVVCLSGHSKGPQSLQEPQPRGTRHHHQRPLGCGAPTRQRLAIFRPYNGPLHHALRCHGVHDVRCC